MKLCPYFELVWSFIILNLFVYDTLCQNNNSPSYVIENENIPAVTWAKVMNKNEQPQLAQSKSSYVSYNLNTNTEADLFENSANNNFKTNPNTPIIKAAKVLHPPPELNPNNFQRRALDFMYHKFVEPKTHEHVEPRPSLIEELIGTFETHVKKDLAAWNRDSDENTSSKRETPLVPQSSVPNANDLDIQSSANVLITSTGGDIINSVTNVEEGESDDTFIVTDDLGKKHIITVDEIINSLSHLNENEINHLLLGSSPIEPNIERADQFYSLYEDPVHSTNIQPYVSKDIQYSRKGVNDDDIILIQSEDGDTRLVTVKDARLSTQEQIEKGIKNKKQNRKPSFSSPTVPNNLPTDQNFDFHFTSKYNEGQNSVNSFTKVKPSNQEKFLYSPSETVIRKSELLNNNNNNNNYNNNNNNKFIKNRENTKKKTLQAASSTSHLQGVTAPNSPPLKVINTEASIIDFLPFQNTVTIKGNSPPIIQKTGLRKRLSNFFSRLVGKPSKDRLNISNRDELDQFVQIVMPRSDSNTMEQITIPLPKPIHHKGRNIQVSDDLDNANKRNRARRRSTISDLFKPKEEKKEIEERSHLGEDKQAMTAAELILSKAQVPDTIKEKLIAQMGEKPKFLLPNFENLQDEQIDRSYRYHNKETKKDIKFPVGYTYEVPSPYEDYDPYYYPEVQYDKDKGKNKHKKGQDSDEQPLLDINLLADLVFVSKTGDDNESFSFPKIGDASRFVDVRRVQY